MSKLKIIKFEKDNCAPCKTYNPIFEEFKKEHDNIEFETVDVIDKVDLARKYKILSVPTTIVLEDDEIVERKMGVQQKNDLKNMISDYVEIEVN